MSIRKDYPATATLIAVIVCALAMCAAYIVAIILVVGELFDAADAGDTPHTIAWAAILVVLALFGYSSGSRTKRGA